MTTLMLQPLDGSREGRLKTVETMQRLAAESGLAGVRVATPDCLHATSGGTDARRSRRRQATTGPRRSDDLRGPSSLPSGHQPRQSYSSRRTASPEP